MRPRRGPERPPEEPRTRVNDSIRVPQVRLIGADGEQIGIKSRDEALEYAWNLNLDLVEVAADARPPVCRVMDYSKYKYEQEQKAKLARRHQNVIVIKEIKLRPKVGQHDYETKRGHVLRFLKNRDKVKVTIMFRGRETTHPERGQMLLLRLAEDVKELATIEAQPLLDGRNMTMLLAPLRKPDADEPEDEPVEVVGPAPRQRRQARIEASSGSATAVVESETEIEDEIGIEDEVEDATPADTTPLSSTNGSQEDAAATEGEAEQSETPSTDAPEVVAPEVVAPEVVAPEVVDPEVVAPEVVAPEVVAPEVPKPRRTAKTATATASTPAPTPRAKAAPRRKAPSTTSTTTEAEPPSTPA